MEVRHQIRALSMLSRAMEAAMMSSFSLCGVFWGKHELILSSPFWEWKLCQGPFSYICLIYFQGEWAFESPCVSSKGGYTTSIIGSSKCNQHLTSNSPLGTEMSASASYQTSYSSIPFCSPGKLMGLTMKKMFANVFSSQPDNVFIASWNEFLAQPQSNPFQVIFV